MQHFKNELCNINKLWSKSLHINRFLENTLQNSGPHHSRLMIQRVVLTKSNPWDISAAYHISLSLTNWQLRVLLLTSVSMDLNSEGDIIGKDLSAHSFSTYSSHHRLRPLFAFPFENKQLTGLLTWEQRLLLQILTHPPVVVYPPSVSCYLFWHHERLIATI